LTDGGRSPPIRSPVYFYLFTVFWQPSLTDVLLEPLRYLNLSVTRTTQITSVWGTFVLLAILIAWLLEGRLNKKSVAHLGNYGALFGFLIIILGGITRSSNFFYIGVILLGFGTGLSTVANLSLMFDLTPGRLDYSSAPGISSTGAAGRFCGGVYDVVTRQPDAIYGYIVVFSAEACMLLAASILLTKLMCVLPEKGWRTDFVEKIALAAEST
jgi:BCD family chlorophyll transporter-like MFS transporter